MDGAMANGMAKRRKVDGEDFDGAPESRTYSAQRVLGKGSFGVVYQAVILETNEVVAIKSSTLQDKDREVQILKELEGHPNIIGLRGAFVSDEGGSGVVKLNLVLEFVSDTLHRVIKHYNVLKKPMDIHYVKLYLYQLLRALSCVHGRGIVHADIKPQNLLLEGKTHCLKLCDFGTARRLRFGEPSRPYVCSRYYRAPECILGATDYTTSIDLWSSGCVFGEMVLGQPLFTGKDGINQLVEIIKILGTPTSKELTAMNPNYPNYDFTPRISAHSWDRVFKGNLPKEGVELVSQLLRYDPSARTPPLHCLVHNFFDSLRAENKPQLHMLFNFREDELWWATSQMKEKLVPRWYVKPPSTGNGATVKSER